MGRDFLIENETRPIWRTQRHRNSACGAGSGAFDPRVWGIEGLICDLTNTKCCARNEPMLVTPLVCGV